MGKKLDSWIADLRRPANEDVDRVVLLTGLERTGKSNTALWLARKLDPVFPVDNIVFSARELKALGEKSPPGTVIVLDEAIKGAFSRDAMTEDNKELVRYLVVCGERRLVLIINFPNIKWVDSYITDHRYHWWGLMKRRGVLRLHGRRPSDYRGAKVSRPQWAEFENIPLADRDLWMAYLEKKRALVRSVALDHEFQLDPLEVEAAARKVVAVLAR